LDFCKKVLRETSPKTQQRDETSTKKLEDAPESQVENGTAMVFPSESRPKPSNPKGRVLLRPNLPDLVELLSFIQL
jgi:hypothetical protein